VRIEIFDMSETSQKMTRLPRKKGKSWFQQADGQKTMVVGESV